MKLGHQLEKDNEQQLQNESNFQHKQQSMSPRAPEVRQIEKTLVQCWRCKGHHPPGNCPGYASSNQSFQLSQPSQSKRPHQSPKQDGQPSNNAVSIVKTESTMTHVANNPQCTVPHQLVVPINIGAWKGKAILDTGASYTLIHESLWRELTPQESLHPWTSGPLYLANGEAEVPLGWVNVLILLHDQSFYLVAAVLTSTSLTYAVVLGLDFIFLSGLQLNIADRKYIF